MDAKGSTHTSRICPIAATAWKMHGALVSSAVRQVRRRSRFSSNQRRPTNSPPSAHCSPSLAPHPAPKLARTTENHVSPAPAPARPLARCTLSALARTPRPKSPRVPAHSYRSRRTYVSRLRRFYAPVDFIFFSTPLDGASSHRRSINAVINAVINAAFPCHVPPVPLLVP